MSAKSEVVLHVLRGRGGRGVISLVVALLVLVGAVVLSWRLPVLMPYLFLVLALVAANLMGAVDQVVTETRGLEWGWAQLLLLGAAIWGLLSFFRGGLYFLLFLLLSNVSGLGQGMQQVSWRLYGVEKRSLTARVTCPEKLVAGARLYRVTDEASGHVILVKAGRSTLTKGPALCAATMNYLPLLDRFDRWDADRGNVRSYMSVNDYRAVVFYPSLKKSRVMFPVKIQAGNMFLPVGRHTRWGIKIELLRG